MPTAAAQTQDKERPLPDAPPQHAPRAAGDPSDEALLLRIARAGDREAYGELYRRYQSPAYSLARYLTQSGSAAEDAFQEGMLRVWLYAKSYKEGGNARGWILRTVARQSMKRQAVDQKEKRHMSLDEELDAPDRTSEEEAAAERAERSAGLRRSLAELAPAHRQMVLLYYVGGLTQKEIGRELAMPTRTVSYKLEEAVQRLRESLAKAGLAAALPLLDANALGEALVASQPAPEGLFARVGERLANAPQANLASEVSRRAAPAGGSGVLIAAAALAVLATGTAWWALHGKSVNTPAAQGAPLAQAAHQAPGETEDQGFDVTWTFENGKPDDLKVLAGPWALTELNPGVKGMRSGRDVSTYVVLPTPLPQRPMRVDLVVRHQDNSISSFWGLMRARGNTDLSYDSHSRAVELSPGKTDVAATFYVLDDYNVKLTNGKVHSVRSYKEAATADRLVLGFQNATVLSIRARTIEPAEVPAAFHDPRKLIVELKLVQTEKDGKPMPGHSEAP